MKKQLSYTLIALCITLPLITNSASAICWGCIGSSIASIGTSAASATIGIVFGAAGCQSTSQGMMGQAIQEGQAGAGTTPTKPKPPSITMQNINIVQAANKDGVTTTTAEETKISSNIAGDKAQSLSTLHNVLGLANNIMMHPIIIANQAMLNNASTPLVQRDSMYTSGHFDGIGMADYGRAPYKPAPNYQSRPQLSYTGMSEHHRARLPLVVAF
jgi:hypothetical protein